VKNRDKGVCCFTGNRVGYSARTGRLDYTGYEVAHVFPLSLTDQVNRDEVPFQFLLLIMMFAV
jgi:hypothetical protein